MNNNPFYGSNISILNKPVIGERGWICPICGRALAPWMSECPCYKQANTDSTTYPNTGTTFPNNSYTISNASKTIRNIGSKSPTLQEGEKHGEKENT